MNKITKTLAILSAVLAIGGTALSVLTPTQNAFAQSATTAGASVGNSSASAAGAEAATPSAGACSIAGPDADRANTTGGNPSCS
jgi:hypothetical protein